tara:strand:+ start:1157 stop:1363 length:207 start_codon:yes stop_codon:yes gene_type:complete
VRDQTAQIQPLRQFVSRGFRMGWFDWLFGRKKKAPQVSTAAAPPKPSVPVPQAVDDPDEDWAEATTFI